MNYKYPDLIRVTPIIRNESFRTESEKTSFKIKAQVEKDNKISYDSSGQPMDPHTFIMLPSGSKISKGDKVNILKLHGKDSNDTFDYHAISVHPAGGILESHIEVTL